MTCIKTKRSRTIIPIFSLVLIISLIASLIILLFSFESIVRVGDYNINKNYQIDYSNGSGGINAVCSLSWVTQNYYTQNFYVNTFSSGDVDHLGLNHIDYDILLNDIRISGGTHSWNSSIINFSEGPSSIVLSGNDNITYTGIVNVSFNVEDTIQNEILNFRVSCLISLYTLQIEQTYFSIYLLKVLDVIVIIGLSYGLYRILRIDWHPTHLTNDIVKKDAEYFDFLRKWKKDENQTDKKNNRL